MTPLVFIDGDQGTTGLQVRQWLTGRDDLRLLLLPPEHRKSVAHRAEALNDCDVALLCLPDDAAREAVALVRRPGARVIDASSAHRTTPGWVYGLEELEAAQAARIATAARVSNPGCYPTGALALLRQQAVARRAASITRSSRSRTSGCTRCARTSSASFAADRPASSAYGYGLTECLPWQGQEMS